MRVFFSRCNEMMDRDPEGFAKLASNVQTLDVGRMIGINIDPGHDGFSWVDDYPREKKRCVFDVIAHFKNLESLSIYVKIWWGFGSQRGDAGTALASNLKKLRSLKVGGQMPPLVLEGLAALGPQLKNLTLINLISAPGQDSGPDPVTFLSETASAGFANLETLHLCKLADLHGHDEDQLQNDDEDRSDDEDQEYASGMRWPFPREGEIDVLEEWARLLRHISKTLRSLTLENRYLCSYSWQKYESEFIEPGNGHPDDYGAVSIQQSQRVLFPILFNESWPELKELKLVGMGTADAVGDSVAHLKDRVRIEQLPARFQLMGGDVTPEEISTPYEFLDQEIDGGTVYSNS